MNVSEISKKIPLDIDAFITTKPSDFLYLTGIKCVFFVLFLTKKTNFVFAPKLYNQIKPILDCYDIKDIFKLLPKILKSLNIKKIGFNSKEMLCYFVKQLKKIKGIQLIDRENFLTDLRMIKTQDEIKKIKKAGIITKKAFNNIIQILKPGITEKEVAKKIIIQMYENGADGIAFEPIVAFGKNSAYPHHQSSQTKLEENQPILIDCGATVENYHFDFTRTIFFGKSTTLFKKIFNIVKKAQLSVIRAIKPGIKFSVLDRVAREIINKHSYKEKFIHYTGHGVGLDIHEEPRIAPKNVIKCKENMVFTVEPGIYLENLFGVRIEDIVLLANNKPKIL